MTGIKLLAKDSEVLLQAGNWGTGASYTQQEIPLADGERLVGVRSKLYDQNANHSSIHCNMVLVIGWLE